MSELRDAQRLLQLRWQRDKPLAQTHIGDLAWWSRDGLEALEVEREERDAVAWAWIEGETLHFEVHAERPELHGPLLERHPSARRTWSLDTDKAKVNAILVAGFTRDDSSWLEHGVRSLGELSAPQLPPGYAVRPMTPELVESRVAAHRSAFEPSRLTPEKYERARCT